MFVKVDAPDVPRKRVLTSVGVSTLMPLISVDDPQTEQSSKRAVTCETILFQFGVAGKTTNRNLVGRNLIFLSMLTILQKEKRHGKI